MYQSITLIGNLGSEPELRYTPSGVAVASFRMATSRQWNDAQGQKQEKVNWWRISVWNKQAEIVTQYLHKGSKVLIVGEVEEAKAYTLKDGTIAASVEIKAQTVRFMDSKRDEEGGDHEPPVSQAKAPQSRPATKQAVDPADIPF